MELAAGRRVEFEPFHLENERNNLKPGLPLREILMSDEGVSKFSYHVCFETVNGV